MKVRDVSDSAVRRRIERQPIPAERPGIEYIPDRDLTFHRDGMRWSFAGGKVLINGQDVNRMMNANTSDVGLWLGIAEGLTEYRRRVQTAVRRYDRFSRFESVIDVLLGKILNGLKKIYDEKVSGLAWSLKNGQFVINGINIRSFLALYRLRKTEKAKRYLKGLRAKLGSLMESRRNSPDYERMRPVVEEVYQEIEAELATEEASRSPRRLLPSPSHRL